MSESTATEKACTKCGEVKPLTDYYAQKVGKHGRLSRCKSCTAIDHAERAERLGKIEHDPNMTKACSTCGEVKPLEDFYAKKVGKHGRTPECKACRAIDEAERAERLGKVEHDPNQTKACSLCGETKKLAGFYSSKHGVLGRRSECRSCYSQAKNQAKNADPLWAAYTDKKGSAGAKRHGFALTIERVRELWAETGAKCAYLGIPLLLLEAGAGNGERPGSLSFDRIDSTRGYTDDNVQLISLRANKMKSNATSSELLRFAKYTLNLEPPVFPSIIVKGDPEWAALRRKLKDKKGNDKRHKGVGFGACMRDWSTPWNRECSCFGDLDWEGGNGTTKRSVNFDRIDPNVGYFAFNTRITSQLYNTMKQDASPEELVTFSESTIRIHDQ